MVNFEGIPDIPSPEGAPQEKQNKEVKQEEAEQKSPLTLTQPDKKTAEAIDLIEKSFEGPLNKEGKKRLDEIRGQLDKKTLDFIEEDTEHTWNFIQEQWEKKEGKTEKALERRFPLVELHEKTAEAINLMEKNLDGSLNKEGKKRLEEITNQLDKETLEFIEEKVERKWNFIQERQEEEEEKRSEKKNEVMEKEESKKIENQLRELRQKRQKGGSLVGEEINLIDKQLGGALNEDEKERLKKIKSELGERIFNFIDEELMGAIGFRSPGKKGELETEKYIQKLIKMSPEKMEKEARKNEKENLKLKKTIEELRNYHKKK